MSVFINGIGAISPQGCFPSINFLDEIHRFDAGPMTVAAPKYRDFINPVLLRRMNKFIRMGLASAIMCLNDARVETPEAIITATGLGSVEDTDKFLDNLTNDQEKLLNPTPFIQSTHNVVAARVAIHTGCHDYNMTYVHKNAAFEQALLDAVLKLNTGKYSSILLGASDEITQANYDLKKQLNYWKQNIGNLELFDNRNSPGTIAGEGSVFFYLSAEKVNESYAEIITTKTVYKLSAGVDETITDFLASAHLAPADIDLVLLGINGNVEEDYVYDSCMNQVFKNSHIAWYKHLCGEYETASGFALLLAAQILKTQHIPEFIKLQSAPTNAVKNILIYQQRNNLNHCFTVLSRC